MFDSKLSGFKNEYAFVDYLDGKLFKEVNILFQDMFSNLYGNIDENEMIRCWINYKKEKTDIFVKINDCIKRISLKKGVKNSTHVENIYLFINFLKLIGIDKKIINGILKYHYGDGTLNGTGSVRLSVSEYKDNYQNEIDEINKSFQNKDILLECIDRFILKDNKSNEKIDAVIYGITDDFIWITRDDLIKVFLKHINDYSTSVHFSFLTYQNMNRCLNSNKKYEDKRNYIQIKWYNICDNIIESMNDRVMVEP